MRIIWEKDLYTVCEKSYTIFDHIDYPLFALASKNRLTGWQGIVFVKKMGSFTCWIAKAGFRCTQGAFIFGILYGGGEKNRDWQEFLGTATKFCALFR